MRVYKSVAPLVALIFTVMQCLMIPLVHAAPVSGTMLSTSDVLIGESRAENRASILRVLDRQDAAQALTRFGVSEEQLVQRLDRLTDAELATLAQQSDSLPAGESAVGALVFILVLLLVLDLLGVTNVFPGIGSGR